MNVVLDLKQLLHQPNVVHECFLVLLYLYLFVSMVFYHHQILLLLF